MSMHITWNDATQGSEEWLACRRGLITGSRARDARDRLADKPEKIDKKTGEITPAVRGAYTAKAMGYAYDVARDAEGGSTPEVYQNAAMRTGTEQEPVARAAYEDATGYIVEEVGFAHNERFGCSVDGIVFIPPAERGMVEIKAMVSSATLFKAMVGGDISEYIDQCLFAMWLLDLQWCDLCLWCPDLPRGNLHVVRIERDEAAIAALAADMLEFDALVQKLRADLRARMDGPAVAPKEAAVVEATEQLAFVARHGDSPVIDVPAKPAPADIAEPTF